MFRHRTAERATAGTVYEMRQRMLAIGDDYFVQDAAGRRVFKVDGKALRLRKTLVLETADGQELYHVQEKLLHVRDTVEIEGPTGRAATVKKALISPLRERYTVELTGGGEWTVQGNIFDHEYEIEDREGRVAEIGKRWFRALDTYGIEVAPGHDDALVVAVAVVVDELAHAGR